MAGVSAVIDGVFAAAKTSVPEVFGESRMDEALQRRFGVAVPWLARALMGEKDEKRRGALVEAFIQRLDIGWREAGVGDMGVGKRVRAMAGALHGRIERYVPLLAAGERAKLAAALAEHGVVGAEKLAAALVGGDRSAKLVPKADKPAKKSVARGRKAG